MCWGTISLKISGISRNKPKNKQPANAKINPQLVAKTSPMSQKIRKVGNTESNSSVAGAVCTA